MMPYALFVREFLSNSTQSILNRCGSNSSFKGQVSSRLEEERESWFYSRERGDVFSTKAMIMRGQECQSTWEPIIFIRGEGRNVFFREEGIQPL